MVTRCDDNAKELADITHDILMDYAKQWGCDFIVLDKKEEWMTDYELAHYRIFEVRDILEHYERVLVIDSDIVIMPGCPNPFDIVPEDRIGTIFEDVGSREKHRQTVIQGIQAIHGYVGWNNGYINTGFFVVSRKHKDIFQRINGKLWTGFGYDDALIGWNIHKYEFKFCELPFQFNHMSMFSEPWNGNANRFDSWIIHYAGAANFPDDRSDRSLSGETMTNEVGNRLLLIKSDIDRITEGLMTFKEAKPTALQGLGSRCFDVKIGVQEKDIVLKVPATLTCLEREITVLSMRIPSTVTFLGMGDDPSLGKFLMLEKLYPLEDDIGYARMFQIAKTVLITSRQLWKLGIPWICREEHIMQDAEGNIKLLDFGDDPYMPIPFYGKTDDSEAIIMDGNCCKDGKYQMRYKYPLSGYVAIMKNLCDKYKLDTEKILRAAEFEMVSHEYQNLKDVHQPIYFEPYEHVERTESESNDKNFGKLVPANRDCEDRAEMIYDGVHVLPPSTTWLDIGCNVGWFVFEFNKHFEMTGLDFDHDKILFNKMMAEGERSDAKFMHGEICEEYVNLMPEYDVISAMSMLHLKLVADKDTQAFWDLLRAICAKVRRIFILEFPPHSYSLAGVNDTAGFIDAVQKIGPFTKVEQAGITDNGRPMLICRK